MLKVMSLMRKKEGLSFADFKKWAEQDHPKFAMKIPGMEAYRMNVCVAENPDGPCDAVSEMWFSSEEAMAAGFNTEAGKAAGADATAHCAHRTRLMLNETVVR